MIEAIQVSVPGYGNLTGNPVTIVKLMKAAKFEDMVHISDDAYMDHTQGEIARLYGKHIEFSGDTEADRAESFLKSLAENGLIKIEKV